MQNPKIKEQLEFARRLIDGEEASSKQIAEGARIVRGLAEDGDCLEAWQYMLDCHERGVGPFKTNKFRRAAKAAIARLNFMQSEDFLSEPLDTTDFSWCKSKVKREAKICEYLKARRQLDKFMTKCVQPIVSQKQYAAAAERIGLDWSRRMTFSENEGFAIADFACMYDDSSGAVPIDRAIKETKPGKDPDYDAAMKMLNRLRYTWAKILDLMPGYGFRCRDLTTHEEFFLFERNMSNFPMLRRGAIMCGIVPVGNCFMHTGFGVPIPGDQGNASEGESIEDMFEELLSLLEIPRERPIVLSKVQTARLAGVSIRTLLNLGVADHLKLSFQYPNP